MDNFKDVESLLSDAFAPASPPTPERLHRQRADFIARGVAMGQARLPWGRLSTRLLPPWPRLAAALLLLALAALRLLAAEALPGAPLYTAKLTFEQVEAIGHSPREIAIRRAERREQEVAALVRRGQRAEVAFDGYLVEAGGQWLVAGVPVTLSAEQGLSARQSCAGTPSRLVGTVEQGALRLSHLVPTCLVVGLTADGRDLLPESLAPDS